VEDKDAADDGASPAICVDGGGGEAATTIGSWRPDDLLDPPTPPRRVVGLSPMMT